MSEPMLPAEFADLEPFAATWCLATEPERWERRLATPMHEMQAFYDACFPRAEAAIVHCDQYDLHALPAEVEHLLQMLLSLALVSYVVEVWLEPLPLHTGAAVIDRTREPRP
ncbi:MAG: hypothetical protein M3Z03_12945 [Actinomycetota bacterium]|nr:hypothetical protein [Actinomycetota bacterium]